MGSFERRLAALVAASTLAALAAPGARAEGDEATDEVPIEVTVLRVSDEPGEVDPRVEHLDQLLRGEISYQSLRVLDTHARRLPVNEIWTLELPTEQTLRLRPLEVDREGTLLSLDVEDGLQGDFRVRPGRPLIVGGSRYGDGRLVVVVDTR